MDNQQFDFLDLLTIFNTGLQIQNTVDMPTRQDIMVLNAKLDRLLQLVEGSSRDADRRP